MVYCVLFVMMSADIEKNSAVSKEGHVFSGRKLGQYADQELLNSLLQNKSLKYILIQVHDQQGQQ